MKRRGVTLLEVMFSIGVIIFGLIGVLVIIPFGLYQVGRGNVADRAARAGLNAVEEFEVYGMRRPDSWIHADGTPVQSATRFPASPHVPIGYSFCIDARFVAAPENQDAMARPIALAATPFFDARFFPYYSPFLPGSSNPIPTTASGYFFNDVYDLGGTGRVIPFTQNPEQPRMIRITLKDSPGVPLNIGPPGLGGTPLDLAARMSQTHADRMFIADDDLLFETPKDKTLAAKQSFRWTVGADGQWGVAMVDDDGDGTTDNSNEQGWAGSDDVPVRREFESAISWMATLVPRADFGGFARGEYTLSIVMFSRRVQPYMFNDLNGNATYDAGEATNSERVVSVLSFEGAGFAGGDVTLEASTPGELDFTEGEWLMLGGSAGVSGAEAPDFRWYRIVATEKEPELNTTSMNYERVATLQGSDWQRTEWHLNTTNPAFRPTQATLVKGAVAVYEKVVQLETTVTYPQ